jgi:hypothetical protein
MLFRILAAIFEWLIPEGLRAVPGGLPAVPELRSGLAYSDYRGHCPQIPAHGAPAVVSVTTECAARTRREPPERKGTADARA